MEWSPRHIDRHSSNDGIMSFLGTLSSSTLLMHRLSKSERSPKNKNWKINYSYAYDFLSFTFVSLLITGTQGALVTSHSLTSFPFSWKYLSLMVPFIKHSKAYPVHEWCPQLLGKFLASCPVGNPDAQFLDLRSCRQPYTTTKMIRAQHARSV